MGRQRVAVVVPLHNAEATVGATLASVRAQTHVDLDIIVVDDGSTDRSAELVAAHQKQDPRIRVVSQANRGVAEARNAGAAVADAPLLAFIDADDLWRPAKIERQVQALAAAPQAGLVYAWFAAVDECGRSYRAWRQPLVSGDAIGALCRSNFIGNGSSALVTRDAFEASGGFDPSLRARGGQGCEDLKFYLDVAERYKFSVVPEFLVGYRRRRGAMSSDGLQMLRSFDLVAHEFRRKYPHFTEDLDAQRADLAYHFAMRAASEGELSRSWRLLSELRGRSNLSPNHLRAICLFVLAKLPSQLPRRLAGAAPGARRPLFLELPDGMRPLSTRGEKVVEAG